MHLLTIDPKYITNMELRKLLENGLRPEESMYSNEVTKEYKELARDCWHQDPNRRPSFLVVLDRLEVIWASI